MLNTLPNIALRLGLHGYFPDAAVASQFIGLPKIEYA